MTYFLAQQPQDLELTPTTPDVAPQTYMQGLGAEFEKSYIQSGANGQAADAVAKAETSAAMKAVPLLGGDSAVLGQIMKGAQPGQIYKGADAGIAQALMRPGATITPNLLMNFPQYRQALLGLARTDAEQNPDKWSGVEIGPDQVQKAANTDLQGRLQAAQQDVSAAPGLGVGGVIASLAGSTADWKNVAALAVGGGELPFLKMIGREATLNAAAEGIQIPEQRDMAKRLGEPVPSIFTQLATAAIGGAAFGAGAHVIGSAAHAILNPGEAADSLARGLSYWRDRQTTPDIPGKDPVSAETMVSTAERAAAQGNDPMDAAKIAESVTPHQPEFAAENPTNPTKPPLVPDQITEEALPPPAGQTAQPETNGEIVATAQAAIDKAQAADNQSAKPLLQFLRSSHKGGGEDLRIDPNSPVGQDLKSAGITAKSYPGLYKNGAGNNLDNLVASEMEDRFPGIIDATGSREQVNNGYAYLDHQGTIDLVKREAAGDSSWLRSRADVMKQESDLAKYVGGTYKPPVESFLAKEKAPGGYFVDLNSEHWDGNVPGANDRIANGLDEYLAKSWSAANITPAERAEILHELQTRGGDAEYLVQRVLEREAEHIAKPAQEAADYGDIPWPDDLGASNAQGHERASAGSEQNAGAEGIGSQGEGRSGGQTERTAAGDQHLVPGVSPITERQRLEAQQNARLGGAPQAPDSHIGGLFDPGDKVRTDLFSDPSSTEAQAMQNTIAADMRQQISKGDDFMTSVGGTPLRASAVLDGLEKDQELSDVASLCGGKA